MVEIGPVILEMKIFQFCQCIFSIFRNYLPLENGVAIILNKFEEDENVKNLRQRQNRWTTDKFWSENLNRAFGLGELKMYTRINKPNYTFRERKPLKYESSFPCPSFSPNKMSEFFF